MFSEWVHCLYRSVSCCHPIVLTGCAFPFIGRSSFVQVILSHSNKHTVKYRLFSLHSSFEDRRKQAFKIKNLIEKINSSIPGSRNRIPGSRISLKCTQSRDPGIVTPSHYWSASPSKENDDF